MPSKEEYEAQQVRDKAEREELRRQRDELREVAERYEMWEYHLLEADAAWDTTDGLPHLTRALSDELIEIQTLRNKILRQLDPGRKELCAQLKRLGLVSEEEGK